MNVFRAVLWCVGPSLVFLLLIFGLAFGQSLLTGLAITLVHFLLDVLGVPRG